MEEALQKLKDVLNCSICLNTVNTPKQLQCHHIFCQRCLEPLAKKEVLVCPDCRHNSPAPANAVENLPAAFQINKVLEFVKELERALAQSFEGEAVQMIEWLVKELTDILQPDTTEPDTKASLISLALADINTKCQNYKQVPTAETSTTVMAAHPINAIDLLNQVPTMIFQGVKAEGVAFSQKGMIFVAEKESGRLLVSTVALDNKMKLKSFTEVVLYPNSVALDDQENVLVADFSHHCIKKLSPQGMLIAAAGTQGSGPLQFNYPCSIAFNSRNGKVYVGDLNCCIQILESDLSHYKTFGQKGDGDGELNNPEDIACDSSGNIYVADSINCRIQVFTAEGDFMKCFGSCGRLVWPHGVALDCSDNVYVSERGSHRVSVFTSEGQLVASFGSEGDELGQFKEPRRLAVSKSGVVCVCDHGNDRLQFFSNTKDKA